MSLLKRAARWLIDRQRQTYHRVVRLPPVMPTRRNVLATILVIQATGSMLAVLYLWMWCAAMGGERFPWVATAGVQIAMISATIAWSLAFTAPMGRVEQALTAGQAPTSLPEALLRDTLLQDRPLTAAMLAQWLLGGPALGLIVGVVHGDGWQIAPFAAVLTVLFGTVMPVLVRYELLTRIGFPMTSLLLPNGLIDPLGTVTKGKVYQHIYVLIGLLGFSLPLTLLVLARDPAVSNLMLGLILGDFLLVGAYVGSRVLRVISLPVGYLEEQMDLVRSGRLEVQARLFNIDTFGALISDFNAMIDGLRQRERIRDIFGRYVTQQVAEEILSGKLELGGERRVATVLFADIRGFTPLAEALPPEEVVALLNRYLGAMVSCVLDEGGVLDKFIGDAIMALFGVPVSAGSTEADARAALRCARRMSEEIDRLNADRLAVGLEPVEMGIGLHTGEVVAGNIGIPERMEYTVIGDTVNLSSRLEGLTRTLGRRVLISEETATLVEEGTALERVDTVTVRGRLRPVTVFTFAA